MSHTIMGWSCSGRQKPDTGRVRPHYSARALEFCMHTELNTEKEEEEEEVKEEEEVRRRRRRRRRKRKKKQLSRTEKIT